MNSQFKLTRNGLIRRVSFPSPPLWAELAARIHVLFDIPIAYIGVSYVDADSDEVTLSSEEELRDYYHSNPSPPVIKFAVHDLSATSSEKSLPDTPRTNLRNTFGVESLNPFEVDDDWQRLPSLGGIYVPDESPGPHAFIQSIGSETAPSARQSDAGSVSGSTTDYGNLLSAELKGKGKVSDDITLSGEDLLATPIQPFQPSLFRNPSTVSLPPTTSSRPASTAAVAESIPVPVEAPEAPESVAPPAPPTMTAIEDPSDPPLPEIPAASLTNDVAALINTFSTIFSTHPELSEGLRNIMQNATNGVYWHTHRTAVSQAAGEFMSATGEAAEQMRRRAEEEAGRRVAEAVGGMLRTLSQLGSGTASSEDWRTSTSDATGQRDSTSYWYHGPPHGGWGRGRGRGGGFGHHGHHGHHGHRGGHGDRGNQPPPLPPHPPFGGPLDPMHHSAPWHHPAPPPPPPGPPFIPFPPPAGPPPQPNTSTRPQDIKAQVIAAKELYEQEKERYKAERTKLRGMREARLSAQGATADAEVPPAPEAPAPEPVLVSTGNRKIGYPPLEMYSVPVRHNTYHGHPSRRHVSAEDSKEVVAGKITKRLAAMGITMKAHPTLQTKIKDLIPPHKLSEDEENNIVSTLVEELLYITPKPVPSGSGVNNDP